MSLRLFAIAFSHTARNARPTARPSRWAPVVAAPGRLFVVHKHAARNLHFDLRLEMDGVLRSWAVPKGPSYDMNDKRLAVNVEDHPLEYGDFEGIIPAGNYGAGGIIVWDRGEWIALEDWREGLEKGKLLFELSGYKLHGKWTLVKIKKSERDWLLIKERDAYVKSPGDQFAETSVLSGLTVDEVKAGAVQRRRHARGTREAGAPRVTRRSAQTVDVDARRAGATRRSRATAGCSSSSSTAIGCSPASRAARRCCSRATATTTPRSFPRSRARSRRCRSTSASSTAKSSCSTPQGKPSFSRLQQRGRLTSPLDVRRAAVELPATFFAFDLLAFEDFDLRPLPLVERKELLAEALPKLGAGARARPHRARGRGVSRAGRRRWASRGSSPRRPTRRIAAAASTAGSRSRRSAPATS